MAILNTQMRRVWISLGVGAAGFLAAASVPLFDIDIFAGGGAMIMVGLLIGFTGLVVALLFVKFARVLARMIRGEGVLAHWTYDPAFWKTFLATEEREVKSEMRGLFIIVASLCGLVFVSVLIADVRAAMWVGAALAVTLALCALGAWHRVRCLRGDASSAASPEVLIGREGVWLNGDFFTWAFVSARLESVGMAEGRDGVIEIYFTSAAKNGRQETTIHIPVPQGKEAEAASVLKALEREIG